MPERAASVPAEEDTAPFVYGPIADLYDAWFRLIGLKRGVEHFLDRIDWRLPPRARALDAGAGTGIMGLWFLERFQRSEVISFDIDRGMLAVLERRARRMGHARARLTVAQGDLRTPDVLAVLDTGRPLALAEGSFDAVMVGAALEHVPLQDSVRRLTRLLRPGGVFLTMSVRPGPTAELLARLYRFRPFAPNEILDSLRSAGLGDVKLLPLAVSDFPANFTRLGFIARKT